MKNSEMKNNVAQYLVIFIGLFFIVDKLFQADHVTFNIGDELRRTNSAPPTIDTVITTSNLENFTLMPKTTVAAKIDFHNEQPQNEPHDNSGAEKIVQFEKPLAGGSNDEFYARRMARIRDYCDRNYESFLPHDDIVEHLTKEKEWHNYNVDFPMIVDTIHQLMYCEMPKVGSTNWKRVLMKLTNPKYKDVDLMNIQKVRRFQENNLKKLQMDFEPEERRKMLEKYYKFTFVRNPFERLLSGYKDKGYRPYFPELSDKVYKGNTSKIVNFEARDLEGFEKFLDYLIDRGPDVGLDGHFGVRVRHWTRYYDICHFCAIKYDFVGKIEDVAEDAEYILRDSGVSHLVQYPHFVKATDNSKLIKYYSKIPMEKIEKIKAVFQVDFDLFDYEIPKFIIH